MDEWEKTDSYKVLNKLRVNNIYCVTVEGDTSLLKNGSILIDEKENIFKVKTVAMTHYQKVDDFWKYAELVLDGDVDQIGKKLFITT